jgi:hypothetical protein
MLFPEIAINPPKRDQQMGPEHPHPLLKSQVPLQLPTEVSPGPQIWSMQVPLTEQFHALGQASISEPPGVTFIAPTTVPRPCGASVAKLSTVSASRSRTIFFIVSSGDG